MLKAINNCTELQTIDTYVHAKLLGFKDVFEMYENMMIRGHLHKIKVPTLNISAEDDQIFTSSSLPIDEVVAQSNSSVLL